MFCHILHCFWNRFWRLQTILKISQHTSAKIKYFSWWRKFQKFTLAKVHIAHNIKTKMVFSKKIVLDVKPGCMVTCSDIPCIHFYSICVMLILFCKWLYCMHQAKWNKIRGCISAWHIIILKCYRHISIIFCILFTWHNIDNICPSEILL